MLEQITDFFNNNTMMIIFAAVALVAIVGMFMFKTKQSIDSPSQMSNENTINNMMGRCDPNTGMCFPPTNEEQNQMNMSPDMMQQQMMHQQMMQQQMMQQQMYQQNNSPDKEMMQGQGQEMMQGQGQEMMQGQGHEQDYMQGQEQDTM
jgi:hypothetical protein